MKAIDNKGFYGAKDVMDLMQCSRNQAYIYIRSLNEELSEKGYLIKKGYIPKNYFHERYYAEY